MITIFLNEDEAAALANVEASKDKYEKKDIRIEFIENAPLTAEVIYDKEDAEISVYIRDEMHTNMKKAHHGYFRSGKVEVDDGDEDTVELSHLIAEGVNAYLFEKKVLDECDELDPEEGGILFRQSNDSSLEYKIVEGKNRPSLLCTVLIGAPRMMRPYTDEILTSFAMESMSDEELEEAAENGDPNAMESLAMSYLNGTNGHDEDPEKAFLWFLRSAEAGNEQAMFNAGLFYAKGFGTDRDMYKAAEWMKKAAGLGDEDAESCAKEFDKLAEAYSKAQEGDAQAQAVLAGGLMKLGGSLEQAGEGKDYEESVFWAEKAISQGNKDGYWILSLAYHHGRGVKRDMEKAIELYRKGAEAGNSSCKHNLGCEYMSGENIKKDTHKGFELIKEAAEEGCGLAMRDLGRCYQFATGTTGNMKKAVEWYEKALEVIDDPELAQKTALFKTLADSDPKFSEDYPEDEEDNKEDDNNEDGDEEFDKYMTEFVPEAVSDAWKYEDELDEQGFLPKAKHGEDAWVELPRVHEKASEGDTKALNVLKALDKLNEN